MRPFLAIARKDLRLLARDRGALFWAGCFPVLFALLFGTILRGTIDRQATRMKVVLVDEDGSAPAGRLFDALSRSELLDVHRATAAIAEREVQRGEATAFVRVRPAFAGVDIGIDPTHGAEGAALFGAVRQALDARPVDAPIPPGTPPPAQVSVVSITGHHAAPRTGFELMFPAAIMWGLIGCAGSFAVAMVAERTSGTYVRLRLAPIGLGQIMAGKALACFAACIIDALALLLIARVAFAVRIDGVASMLMVLIGIAWCFAGMTMLLGVLGRSEQATAGAGWATLLVMAMLGGGMVPLAALPSWMQTLSYGSPVRWGVIALEGATWRGLSALELLPSCGVLLGIGAGCFLLSTQVSPKVNA